MVRAILVGVALSLSVNLASAQAPTLESAREDIVRTYNFDPKGMSFDEQAKLEPTLSALWDRYDKFPTIYSAALRQALRTDGNTEMLYCDGGMLLLHKSKAPPDRPLVLASLAKCSLAAIQHTPYFYTLHELAREGIDTLDLQWKILAKPDFSAFIVAHAPTLGQDYAFLYPLLLQDEKQYVSRLVERLKVEGNAVAQKTLVLALWYAATPEAERALRDFATSAGSSSDVVRQQSKQMLDRVSQSRGIAFGAQSAIYLRGRTNVTSSDGESEIRAKRRARMRSISGEALLELDIYTPLLYRSFQ